MNFIEHRSTLKGFGWALLAVILWSANFIIARGLNHQITPISLAFFRWSLATTILLPFALKKTKENKHSIHKNWKHISIAAFTGVTCFNTFIYIAGKYTTAINMALISTTSAPLFVLLVTGLFLKQKLYIGQMLGALVCIIGILLLMSRGNSKQLFNFHFSVDDIWILAAGLSFAIYTVLVRRKPKDIYPVAYLFMVFLVGSLFLLPAFAVERYIASPLRWSPTIILSVIYLAVCASVLAFLFWNLAIHKIGPARTALFGNLIPVFSTMEAVVFLGEDFSNLTLVAMFTILLGLFIANAQVLRS